MRVNVSDALSVAVVLSKVTDSASVFATVILQVADLLEPSAVVAVIIASPTAIAVTRPFSSTVATASSDDVQVTALLVANSGSIVAVNSAVCVASRLISVLSRVIDSTNVGTTVTLQDAERFEPSVVVAVIVASPTAIAVTRPFSSTVATASLEDFHVTALLVANSGRIVVVKVAVSVASRLISVLSSVIDSANVGTTVTLQDAERFEPSAVVAVMVASPTATAVTLPLASTVAIDSFDDFHVTALFEALSGSTVVVSTTVSVALRVALVLSNEIEVNEVKISLILNFFQ